MDGSRCCKQTQLDDSKSWWQLPIHRNVSSTRNGQPDNNSESHRNPKRHRYNVNVQQLSYLLLVLLNANALFPTAVRAGDVGGVSATANPVANSSGSVTNQAIQVLQGPYITNTYGDGISCQGPTLNITPFLTDSASWQEPREYYYNDPVYDVSDSNNDGVVDNPGSILYHVPTRTGQKDQFNFNYGLSATISIPLDGSLQSRCKRAVDSRIKYTNQLVANKRLDFEIARLKNCAELLKAGIRFHPKSKSAVICSDVILVNPPGVVGPHQHTISPSSSTPSTEVNPSSLDNDSPVSPKETTSEVSDQAWFGWLRWPFSRQASPPVEEDQPAALLGGPIQLPPSRSLP